MRIKNSATGEWMTPPSSRKRKPTKKRKVTGIQELKNIQGANDATKSNAS